MSKTNIFFSHFGGTRGEKNQIFCTLVDCLSSPGELGYNMFEKFEQLDVSNDESKNMTNDLQKQIMVLEDTVTDLNKTLNDLIASLTCFS